ncbi:hypothetical protein RRF57_011409 [Xylaria bambusicola]|uniref:Uncharacterized protein n=1 Tax=Xylaria bambusicola TaxID=326684 RepID=A0AAN7UTR0_9PEZI
MSAVNQNPNSALSSAAAAAALRARPHTPTNVAQVQTKRTARRSASVSSSGSARLANGHGQLERRGSTSSMTERTFRTPSPHRPLSTAAHAQQPPVPSIPDTHKSSATNVRTMGVAMQSFRTASQKMADKPPSWHVQPTGDINNVRTSDSAMAIANSTSPRNSNTANSQPHRSDSRSSVNFSYPTAFRPQSPPATPTLRSVPDPKLVPLHPSTSASNSSKGPLPKARTETGPQLVYDPNSRRMVPQAQAEDGSAYQVKQITEKSSKRRRDGPLRREGSQLAKGTVARARGSMVDENKSLHKMSKQEPTAKSLPSKEEHLEAQNLDVKTMGVGGTDREGSGPLPESSGSTFQHLSLSTQKSDQRLRDNFPTDHSIHSPVPTAQDEYPINNERPPVEDYQVQSSQTVRDVLDSVPTQQLLPEAISPSEPSEKMDRQESTPEARPLMTTLEPKLLEVDSEQKVIVADNKPIVGLAIERGDLKRSSSNSPARQARFAPGPAEQLGVRHAPLPRSASPIKSAMKQTSPLLRGISPPDSTSDPSQAGAVSPDRKEEPVMSRKKSVRVSFDDQGPVVLGDSAAAAEENTLITHSPSGSKRAWFSNIGRSKKKDIALDDDEIMKPRPALPSFGSIREKKNRELGERPLVRPLEPTHSPAISSPELRPQSSSTLNDSEFTEESVLGQSSDNALGALLVHDQTSRNAANISRFREPLPPVVTSIEGSGYSSDSMQDSDHEDHPDSTTKNGSSGINPSAPDSHLKQPDRDNSNQHTQANIDTPDVHSHTPETSTTQQKDIPEISVIQPSPMSIDYGSLANGSSTPPFFDVPGGFPDYGSDVSAGSQIEAPRGTASVTVFEPTATAVASGQVEHLLQTAVETARPVAGFDNEEESDESVYSDAYEDIPDLDSGGFMSLDAIVESPHTGGSKNKILPISQSAPVPVSAGKSECDVVTGASLADQAELTAPKGVNDWEQAKAFWRSLTAEKRRQLELEAAEEAGVDGDREEAFQPIRRNNSRRKSSEVTRPPTETPPAQVKPIQPESRMRMSLRNGQASKSASTEPETGMRKSLRSNGGPQSIAKPSTHQAGLNKAPPAKSSTSSPHEATKVRVGSSVQPTSNSGITTQIKPTLQRQGSNASDSSFKRSRPSPGGGFAFRKTMRQPSPTQPRHESTVGSGRFSLRSLSPTGSATRPGSNASFTTSSPGVMKRTLRSNSESSHESKRSSVHFPLFMRSGKSASRSSKYTSRFEDSSDEDEGAFTGFRSRIDDSSDEEKDRPPPTRESKALGKGTLRSSATAPSFSRPAPVPELEEDSPELPDSDDDMTSPLRSPQSRVAAGHVANQMRIERRDSGAIGTSTLSRSRSGRGGFTPSLTSPALPANAKRGSLLGRLMLNRRADQGGKIQRAELVDSAARRDTRLERDRGRLKDLRSEQPSSPKLQKRASTSRHEGKTLQRPTSAGNLLGRVTMSTIERPNLDSKRSLSLNLGSIPNPNPNQDNHELESASVDNSGVQLKKKKFGALRRMFKLDE